MMNPSPVATLPRRSQESRPSHRRADADDDGRARRRSCRVNSGARACAAPPVRDDGQHTWRRRPQASVSESGTCAPPQSPRARGGSGGAMPQTFHQHVNHDESGDDVASDRRLLLAAMVGLAPAITLEAFAGVVVN